MIKSATAVLFITFVSLTAKSQFGFQRMDTIDVYESAVLQKYAWAGGMDFCQFSNIDLNFDGIQDLFVFDRTNNKVLTFLQTSPIGSSNFVYAPQYESKFPQYNNIYNAYEDEQFLFSWVLLVDYNCDGKKDIFASRSGGIKVFKNTGNITDGLSFVQTSLRLKSLQWGTQQFIYVSSADLPGLKDIDGDGDVDIITFGGTGQALEYHRNMSMETYGHCDSLLYEMKNTCWGRFSESSSTNAVTLWDTLVYPCYDMVPNAESTRPFQNEERHSGSTVLPLDMDNDGVMDVVLGDISFPNLVMLSNSGSLPNTNSGMNAVDISFPSNSIAADVSIYPGAYHADINNDGKRDLIVTPSSKVGSENRISTWSYLNTASDLSPVFSYQDNDFLQGEMIDVGSKSMPVYFDHNGDGLKDLLVSCQGHFDPLSGNQKSSIYYYENTGSLTSPEFTLITTDYLNLSTLGIGLSLHFYPTFGDLDNDGDEDMVLGEYSGYCYYFQNTGGAGNAAIFSTHTILNDYMSVPLVTPSNAGIYVIPTLVDLDRDGDLDLVVGRRNGKLNYYENIGDAANYSFFFLTDNLGNVNVSEWWSIEGYAVPQFIDVEGAYKLVVGSKNGYLHLYDSIETNIPGSFHLADSSLDNIQIGTYSAPAITDLNNDNRFEMIVGNERGGVALYKSADISNIGLQKEVKELKVNIYPNPSSDNFTIDLSQVQTLSNHTPLIQIFDLTGRLITTLDSLQPIIVVNTEDWAEGSYLIHIASGEQSIVKKLVVL